MFQPQATPLYPTTAFFPSNINNTNTFSSNSTTPVTTTFDYTEAVQQNRAEQLREQQRQQQAIAYGFDGRITPVKADAPTNDYPRFSNRPHTTAPLIFDQPIFTDPGLPGIFSTALHYDRASRLSPHPNPISQSASPYARPSSTSTTDRSQIYRRPDGFIVRPRPTGARRRRDQARLGAEMSDEGFVEGEGSVGAEMSEQQREMLRQEELAREYDPRSGLSGPNVGEKKSSRLITEAYRDADMIYVEKTTQLPETYSHYRAIMGDGLCGWRAISFSYFEALLHLWTPSLCSSEITRLNTMINTTIGRYYGTFVFEDMLPAFTSVLESLHTITSRPRTPDSQHEAMALITDAFNNDESAGPIVYLMRLFAGARLREQEERFGPFLEGYSSADEYARAVFEPVSAEIEHIGITCLCEVLLRPVGVVLEVVYLDRSPGEVNTFVFGEDGEQGPIEERWRAYLLYRPGHYDILYKDEGHAERQRQIAEAAAQASNIQVHRAAFNSRPHDASPMRSMPFGNNFDLNALSSIPGMSMLGSSICAPQSSYSTSAFDSYNSIMAPNYPMDNSLQMPLQISAPVPSTKIEMEMDSPPSINTPPSASVYHLGTAAMPVSTMGTPVPVPLPVRSLSIGSVEMMLGTGPPTLGNPSQFRHSKYELETKYRTGMGGGAAFMNDEGAGGGVGGGRGENAREVREAQTLQTSMFKNSHYNTAHYNNPNFQPEEYNPGDDGLFEGVAGAPAAKGRRKRSTS